MQASSPRTDPLRKRPLKRHSITAIVAGCLLGGSCAPGSGTTAAADSAAPAPEPANAGKARPARGVVVRASIEEWRFVESQSGPVNYYSLQREAERSFIRGAYQPPNKKAVFGFELPDSMRDRVKRLDWSWRAIKLPHEADECSPKKGDSAAVLYVTWKRLLKWYSLKYVWSSSRPPGTVCDRRRNPFVAQDTIVLRSGGPLGVWQHESIDLARDFRKYFEAGDAHADVPELIGIAVMTDGDQTKTESIGDYADFVFSY